MKKCIKCPKDESTVKFRPGRNTCVECDKEARRLWRQANKDKLSADGKAWRAANKSRVVKTRVAYKESGKPRALMQSSPRHFLYIALRGRKGKSGLRGSKNQTDPRYIAGITLDQLVEMWERQGGRCALSGVPMTHKFGDIKAVSIDRRDSSLGYTVENTQLVCMGINLMKREKSDATVLAFLEEYFQLRKAVVEKDIQKNTKNQR